MTEKYIDEKLGNFYKLFIFYGMAIVVASCVLFVNKDLLLIPVGVTMVVIYQVFIRTPEYLFWNRVKSFYRENTLERYIEKEYDEGKNAHDFKKKHETDPYPIGLRYQVQYQAQKDVFLSNKRFNKLEYLLHLKKLLEEEQKTETSEFV